MVTPEDIESFLLRMEEDAEEVQPGMWVVGSEAGSLVIHHSPPLLLLRMKVMELPRDAESCNRLFRRLLELNATDLVHGAYAIEMGDVILTDTLELERLDFDSFRAAVDSMQLSMASHLESLSPFREC